MKIVQHFISNEGFEACIEMNQGRYRVGWKSPKATNFTFVCCKFERVGRKNKRWGYSPNLKNGFNFTKMTPERERIHTWTTYSASVKRFNQMINNYKQTNFK